MSKHKHKKDKWQWNSKWNWDRPVIRPKLYIEPKAYEKMSYYIQLANGEISGFGKIKYITEHINKWNTTEKIILEDVEIFEQRCSGGGTTLQGESLSKFRVWQAKTGRASEMWNLWWHSHNDFRVGWSEIDELAISELIDAEDAELLSVCMNKDSDIVARRDRNKGKKYEKLSVCVLPRIDIARFGKCEREYKKKITEVKFRAYKYKIKNWNRNWNEDILLLDYKPNYVKTITDRDAINLLYRYDAAIGLYIRNKDNKIMTPEEVKREFCTSKRFGKSDKNLITVY